jgi:acetyl esterase/lipase
MNRRTLFLSLFAPLVSSAALFAATPGETAGVQVIDDVSYKTGASISGYEKTACTLDLYLPTGTQNFPTLVWFHGGGLTGGNKKGDRSMAEGFAKSGIAVVSTDCRLSPKAKYPAYVQDAAAAVAWVHAHITEHGGDPARLFVGGHSAGGYLTLLIGLDGHYLREAGMDAATLAGLIPVSGETVTHFTVRAERGIGRYSITADEAAPIFYGRKETPPMLVLYADHDMPGRAEENVYFVAVMHAAGNQNVTGRLIQDRTHSSINTDLANENDPARLAILDFIRSRASASTSSASDSVKPLPAQK